MKKTEYTVVVGVVLLVCALLCAGPASAATEETWSATYTPWSGYWWPFQDGGLVTGGDYRGEPSPLSKYDYVTSGNVYGPAYYYGAATYYDPDAKNWEGLCFLWAAASIMEAEPTQKGIYGGVAFRVGDKKGLLTVKYHGVIYNKYTFETPLDFHQFLETFIRDQRTPVMLDLGDSGEIWNHPVYKYTTRYTESDNVRNYTTTIFCVSDFVEPDYVGAKTFRETFQYQIQFDPGDGSVISSWWADPEAYTPKRGYEVLGTECSNPTLDPAVIDEIVAADDDGHEENDTIGQAVAIGNGSHYCIAADADYFSIHLAAGDRLELALDQLGSDHLTFNLLGTSDEILHAGEGPGSVDITADRTGEHHIEIIPPRPELEREYTLNVKQSLPHQAVFPISPSGLYANGFALLDWPEAGSRKLVTLMSSEGTVHGGVNLSDQGPYLKGILESYGLNPLDNGYILVDSDEALPAVHAAATASQKMLGSNVQPAGNATDALFFPYTPKMVGLDTHIGILNFGDSTETLMFEGYDSDGLLLRSYQVTLDPGEKYEQDTMSMFAVSPSTKSLQATTQSGNEVLLGYYKLFNLAYDYKGGAVVPLGPPSASDIYVPQVASSDLWETRFHLMNAGLLDAAVAAVGYGEDGSAVVETTLALYPMQQASLSVSELFANIDPASVASLRFRPSDGDLISGMVLYERNGMSQFTGMPLQSETRSGWTLPHIPDPSWDTCIAILNAGAFSSETAFVMYDANGGVVATEQREIGSNRRLAFNLAGMFSKALREKAAFLTITSKNDQPMVGCYFYATGGGVQLMGGPLQ